MMRRFKTTMLAFALVTAPAMAEEWADDWADDPWAEESQAAVNVHGFAEYAYGEFTGENRALQRERSLNEARARLELDGFQGVEWSLKVDARHDEVLAEDRLDLREAQIQWSPLDSTDIRFGRQVLTWGTGDLVFINDLFPKDWESFLAGRDDEYLKAPSDALRVTHYADSVNVDVAWMPAFEPDTLIDGERFSYFAPAAGDFTADPLLIRAEAPAPSVSNSEVALRLFRNINGVEYAVYGYNGFWKQPLAFDARINKPVYPPLTVAGASVRGTLFGGVANAEAGYYDSRDDRSGRDPLVPNSQWRALLGYEAELVSRLTTGIQYYMERISDHDRLLENSPVPSLEPVQRRDVLTLRLRYRLFQDRLTLGSFVFYSTNVRDHHTRLTMDYRYSDQWSMSAGGNFFNGREPQTFYGQFEQNENLYLRVRFTF